MIEGEIVQPGTRASVTQKRGWFDAYKLFLLSHNESFTLKLAPLALLGYLPIDLLDEFIPFIGLLDDVPYVLLAGYVVVATARRLKHYR